MFSLNRTYKKAFPRFIYPCLEYEFALRLVEASTGRETTLVLDQTVGPATADQMENSSNEPEEATMGEVTDVTGTSAVIQ